MVHLIRTNAKSLVLHVNVHGLNLAYERAWLRDFLNVGDIVFCDGAGVKLGAWLLGSRIPQRITYADWIWELIELGQLHGYTFFFLGSQPEVVLKAVARIKEQFPHLVVVGFHHGFFDKTADSAENRAVIAAINRVRPDILIVGFGMPLQERWLLENWSAIDTHVALTGGAVFDYVSGELRRAPAWMTDNGLEWLGRLFIEPRRLWRRYLIGNPLFLWRVFKQRLNLLFSPGNSSGGSPTSKFFDSYPRPNASLNVIVGEDRYRKDELVD